MTEGDKEEAKLQRKGSDKKYYLKYTRSVVFGDVSLLLWKESQQNLGWGSMDPYQVSRYLQLEYCLWFHSHSKWEAKWGGHPPDIYKCRNGTKRIGKEAMS